MASKNYHFIAIGGSIMHALAIALKKSGNSVSGSDDAIYGVSRDNLENAGLLPERDGWYPDRIGEHLDAVILGMHARADNPELERAKELGLPVMSFPEFLYEYSREKKRVVIGGSHGKSTITAMCVHALDKLGYSFDYIIGAPPGPGMPLARLSDAPIMLFEGDEYLSSPLDPRPKFLHYHHDIGLLSGIEWDHANVFPTIDIYLEQFRKYVDLTPETGTIIYNIEDPEVKKIVESAKGKFRRSAYKLPSHRIYDGRTYYNCGGEEIAIQVFGEHNLMNMEGARLVCQELGVTSGDFAEAIQDFTGAGKRLQLLAAGKNTIYSDFAHSPSKVRATTRAVAKQHPERKLVAVLEIHTFSSLNKMFLPEYSGSLDPADLAYVYYDPEVVQKKKLEAISPVEVKKYFGGNVNVFTDPGKIISELYEKELSNTDVLFMSSGNFGGVDLREVAEKLK